MGRPSREVHTIASSLKRWGASGRWPSPCSETDVSTVDGSPNREHPEISLGSSALPRRHNRGLGAGRNFGRPRLIPFIIDAVGTYDPPIPGRARYRLYLAAASTVSAACMSVEPGFDLQ